MNKIIKVMLGDDSVEYGVNLAGKLRDLGVYAYTRKKDGNVIFDAIQNDTPDVAVVDLTMPNLDAIALMKKLSNTNIKKPEFIVTSTFDNSFIEKQVMESGAAYFMVKPFDEKMLSWVIKAVAKVENAEQSGDLEIVVTDVIRQIGIPAHIKGYHYLRTAILSAMDNRAMLESVTKMLYPAVARSYGTTSSRVERAIRHAIEVAWVRGNTNVIDEYFGYSVKGKPTNSEFIALITDKLNLRRKMQF